MLFKDDQSYTPKYIKVKQYLLNYLRANKVKPGEKLPSENELVKLFNISRITVRQAIDILVNDQTLYRVQGKGTYYRGQQKLQTTNIIGVIFPVTSHYIYADIIAGIDQAAHFHGYNILTGSTDANPDKELSVIESMISRGIDGLIIEPALSAKITKDSAVLSLLKNIQVPVVLIDTRIDGLDLPYVNIDDYAAGYMATEFLIKKGHRDIAFVYKSEITAGKQRCSGYRQALSDHNIPLRDEYIREYLEISESHPRPPAYEITNELISLSQRPTAIFFYNDQAAMFGSHAVEDSGLSIPDDISIIGFDDSQHALYTKVPLTTVSHPKGVMGEQAAHMLISEIQSPGQLKEIHRILKTDIIERESVRNI